MSAAAPRGGEAVPFITPDASGGLAVTPEAIALLSRLGPVAPIAVLGKYRTGKSFLSNALVGSPGAFEVGPTVEACTKGIWLWSEPLPRTAPDGTPFSVIFLDTECVRGYDADDDAGDSAGALLPPPPPHPHPRLPTAECRGMSATGSSAEHDARVFALATLLCSVLVYNSVGAIDEEAIQSLTFIANLTKHIQLRSGAGAAESAVVAGAALEASAAADEGGGGGGASSKRARGGAAASATLQSVAGGEEHYVGEMRAAARTKRAAAKRAAAVRLREEARRSAGVRRVGGGGGGGGGTDEEEEDGGGGAEEREVSAFFPTFLWVLRDFSLALLDDDGAALSSREYLEACLEPQSGFSSDVQARNRTRRVLTAFFKERDCVTLVRPLDDEAGLQGMGALPLDRLRPEFREQLAAVRERLIDELARPKTMQGQWVTGRMLAGLAEAYVAAINADAVPSIGNAWEGVTRVECAVSGGRVAAGAHARSAAILFLSPPPPPLHPPSPAGCAGRRVPPLPGAARVVGAARVAAAGRGAAYGGARGKPSCGGGGLRQPRRRRRRGQVPPRAQDSHRRRVARSASRQCTGERDGVRARRIAAVGDAHRAAPPRERRWR